MERRERRMQNDYQFYKSKKWRRIRESILRRDEYQ